MFSLVKIRQRAYGGNCEFMIQVRGQLKLKAKTEKLWPQKITKIAALNAWKDRVANEIARYLQFPTIDGDDDPPAPVVEILCDNVNDFPLLSQYVRRYLAIPAGEQCSNWNIF
jgi:hypothetical protein